MDPSEKWYKDMEDPKKQQEYLDWVNENTKVPALPMACQFAVHDVVANGRNIILAVFLRKYDAEKYAADLGEGSGRKYRVTELRDIDQCW